MSSWMLADRDNTAGHHSLTMMNQASGQSNANRLPVARNCAFCIMLTTVKTSWNCYLYWIRLIFCASIPSHTLPYSYLLMWAVLPADLLTVLWAVKIQTYSRPCMRDVDAGFRASVKLSSVCSLRVILCIKKSWVLFANSSQSTLHRLQRVQDAATRLLCGASARTHAPPLLKQLHWLPVLSRIQFKLCTLMFDINHGTAPQYLSELVRRCDDTRLRSSVRGNFVVSRTRLHVTDKAFSIARPRAWNALPSDIKLISSRTSFRKKLKTHFFSLL